MGMSLQASLNYERAESEGVACGGHFSGSTVGATNIGGNPAGDAVYTFIAQSRRMVVNACSIDYDTVIRVFHNYTTVGREYTLQIEGYRYRAGRYRVDITCVSPL